MQKYQHIIASFLLLLFIAAQTSMLHEFSHEDDAQECNICLLAHDFQSESFDIAPAIEIPTQVNSHAKREVIIDLAFAKAESLSKIYTTRPPPFSSYL